MGDREQARLRQIAALCRRLGLAIAAVGLAVIGGWAFHIPVLKSPLPGLATMKANTAVGFVFGGGALWLSAPGANAARSRSTAWLARGLAVLVGVLGLSTLLEYQSGSSLGIDELLFRDVTTADAPFPGRMALMTAVNFTLLAAALLLLDVETRGGRRPANWLALAIAVNSFLAILGYLYGADALYRVAALTSVAVHTALLFVVASLAVACARPATTFVRQIAGDNVGGQMNRRLLPAAIMLPALLGGLRWQGELAGHYSTAFGIALYSAGMTLVFAILIWFSARALQRSHDRRMAVVQASDWQQAIINSADFTVISTDTTGMIRTVNAGVEKMLGYRADELVGRAKPTVLHDAAEVAARAQALSRELGCRIEPGFDALVARARRGRGDESDWTYIRKDGSRFPVRLSVTALTDARGALSGFLGIGKDISAETLAQQALLASQQRLAISEARLRAITDAVPALISYVDGEQRFRFTNATHAQWLDRPQDRITGQRLDEVFDASTYALIRPHLETALQGEPTTFEFHAPAFGRFVRGTFLPDADPDGHVLGVYGLINDISRQKEVEDRLRQLAQFDTLTGVANRNHFDVELPEAIMRSERNERALALMFLDVDRFKSINDTFGHRGGDLALQEFARRISDTVRVSDSVARLAGDEFVVILELIRDADEANLVAAKIIAAMAEPFEIGGRPCALSTSIGIAVRRHGEDAAALLARADAALYRAKASGRCSYTIET